MPPANWSTISFLMVAAILVMNVFLIVKLYP